MPAETREYRVITLNDVRFPSDPVVGYNNTGTLEGKIVDGDYTRDSDKLMSSKIWTTLSAGIGKDTIREGADEGRYWFGLASVDKPFQFALPEKIESYASIAYPLGDVGNTYYGADEALNIYAWDESSLAFSDTTADLGDAPTFRGVQWNGSLYIPNGANGYTKYFPATTVTSYATPTVVDFVVWDKRLFCLTTDGKLQYTLNGTTWATTASLDSSVSPRHLAVYLDRNENEVIYVVTKSGLWVYDPASYQFVRTRVRIPPHPDNGLGVDVFRTGEDLFFSAGLQVYRYSGAAIIPMGPDRSDGVPDELRGRVIDLCSEHNSMLALIDGVVTSSVASPEIEIDPGLGEDEEMEFSPTTAVSSVLAWTGDGWQPRWISPDDTEESTWLCVSGTDTSYRVWWGWGGDAYSLPLSRPFSNIVQKWRTGETKFEASGYVDLGWVDHNMREFDKLACHIEVNLVNGSATELVRVLYKIDDDTSFTELGTATTTGKTILPFGVTTLSDGTRFSRGTSYRRIRIRVEFERGSDETQTPIVDSIVLKHIRLPLTGQVFTLSIPLDFDEWEGRSVSQIMTELDALLGSPEFVRLSYGYDDEQLSHRVRLSRLSGQNQTGLNPMGGRQVTIIAVPLDGYDGMDMA